MVGRYEIIKLTRPSPTPASANASTTRPAPFGRTNPSVNSDEPLVTNASENGEIPVPQKATAHPRTTRVTQTAGNVSNANGA